MDLTWTDVIAGLALILTLYQLWVTSVRRGKVLMTRPTSIAFVHDDSRVDRDGGRAKIYLRALLYSTGQRGHVVDSMYVRLLWSTPEGVHRRTFSVWVFGEDRLARGSGLYVGPTGVAMNHHFVLGSLEPEFAFAEQRYTIEVYASIVGWKTARLFAAEVRLSSDQAAAIIRDARAVYFDWVPDQERYSTLLEAAPMHPVTSHLIDSQ
jgi:hypothetical protein